MEKRNLILYENNHYIISYKKIGAKWPKTAWKLQNHSIRVNPVSGSEYARVLNVYIPSVLKIVGYPYPKYVRIIQDLSNMREYRWICIHMPGYTRICVNMPKYAWMAFVLHFPIVIPCLIKRVVSHFNAHMKLDVIVWRNMSLFSWRNKTWFFSIAAGYIWLVFCFRLKCSSMI